MKIKSFNYNWRPVVRTYSDGYGGTNVESSCEFDNYTVGSTYSNGDDQPRKECIRIEEHLPMGEGDKLFYDVFFSGASMIREFNPNEVFYENIE